MIHSYLKVAFLLSLLAIGCRGDIAFGDQNPDVSELDPGEFADVLKVVVLGNEGEYEFQVTVSSPDTGCEKYADFWEVVSKDGELIYRRILAHSHVNEQPFTRSGGPVPILSDQSVWVRAHINTAGYGGTAYFGAATNGFVATEMPEGFAEGLIVLDPKPTCAF